MIYILQKHLSIFIKIVIFKKYKDYHLKNSDGEIIIDTDNDKLAGYGFVNNKKNDTPGFITPVEVMKKYRGYGLGNKLVKDLINKYDAVDLVVMKDNEVAVNLYKKHGFVIISNGNTKDKDYWMKLKTKLTKEDKERKSNFDKENSR